MAIPRGVLVEIARLDAGLPEDVAAVWQALPLDQLEQGALAGAVVAGEADMLAGVETKARLLVQGLVADVIGQVVDSEHTHGCNIHKKTGGRYATYRPPVSAR